MLRDTRIMNQRVERMRIVSAKDFSKDNDLNENWFIQKEKEKKCSNRIMEVKQPALLRKL